jgi:hypothetical protein
MESPIEFHSQMPDTGVEDSCGFGCANQNPGQCFYTDWGLLFHELIVLDFHEGVKHNLHMRAKKLPADIRDYFVKMGSEGGKLGGRIRADKLSKERRTEIARNASVARWAKKKQGAG